MKIKAISIENFGKLSGFHCSFHGGINAIVQRNGWGKSTLAAKNNLLKYSSEAPPDDIGLLKWLLSRS